MVFAIISTHITLWIKKKYIFCFEVNQQIIYTKVKYSFQDCLTRQIAEGVAIMWFNVQVLNTKAEWHQPAIWRVRSELSQE
jgi:hypothetical protein